MESFLLDQFVLDLVVVLSAGLLSGVLCKRVGVSLLVGYLVVGAVIGEGGLHLVSQENHELESLAKIGAWLLLFAVGIEFSFDELKRMSRFFVVGGATQMVLVAVPLGLACRWLGLSPQAAFLVAAAGAFSSTVLVFKALAEWGQTASPHGRRAIGVLLFQDVALVPLMLVAPLLTGQGEAPGVLGMLWLAASSTLFVGGVVLLRRLIDRWAAAKIAELRSVEIVVLFALVVFGVACLAAHKIGLPPALGALGAGLMMSGNRLSKQVDAVLLPFRESFAVVFFVTLGTLLHPATFFHEPVLLGAGLLAVLALKSIAAALALRLTGLGWKAAAGMGVGLAQLGEFSFLLIHAGETQGVISAADYNRVLFIAMGTLILTPVLVRLGLRWTTNQDPAERGDAPPHVDSAGPIKQAMVIGLGPIGRQTASRLDTLGAKVCLVDLSTINLQPYSQAGFHVVAGDARDSAVLHRAQINDCRLAVVCVPNDRSAIQVVGALRACNKSLVILVRCRYVTSTAQLAAAGADRLICEEQVASGALIEECETILQEALTQQDAAPADAD